MSFYNGPHARVYDLIYQDKPYEAEARFLEAEVRQLLGRRPLKWLDLACGSGRHALAFERLGYAVTGVDVSQDLLAVARENVTAAGAKLRLLQADMRSLDLGVERFDVITCLFDSIGYVRSNEAIVETLQSAARHLSKDGVFIAEYWHAPAMLKHFEHRREKQFSSPGLELRRVAETTVDVEPQLCSVAYTLYGKGADGSRWTHTETQQNRYFSVQEMAALLKLGGLTPCQQLAGYSRSAKIGTDTWHVLAFAHKTQP